MPDKRRHRGAHPADLRLFGPEHHISLQSAVTDLCWLLTRGYAEKSALKIVGDRHALSARQRQAVGRCSCGNAARNLRREKAVPQDALRGSRILIDGFNVLKTLETALSGGVILPGRDDCYRDIAGMHGNYRVLEETRPALQLLQDALASLGVIQAGWYFDQSVSNSGRVKTLLAEIVEASGGPAAGIELVPDPDPILADSKEIVASGDSDILDHCARWFNLARHVIEKKIPDARVVPMQGLVASDQ